MASGIPTVAFNYGAAGEHLANGVHGACVDSDDGFIQAAVRIGCDDQLRQAMGEKACAAVAALRPDRVAADFDALLRGIAMKEREDATVATA